MCGISHSMPTLQRAQFAINDGEIGKPFLEVEEPEETAA
jgi:hypothetical protein